MKTGTQRVAAAVMAVCLLGSGFLAWELEALRPEATLEDVMYIKSPSAIRYVSLGYTGLAASLYWTRAVQYFGGKHHVRSQRYDLLYPLLDLTATLDRKLLVAYEFGSFFLAQKPPEGAGDPDQAAKFAERGIANNPEAWRLYYHLGFIHAIERKDYATAADVFQKGSEVPGAYPWMRVLAAEMRRRGGDLQTSRFLWERIYESSDDKQIKLNAAVHLVALRVEEEVTILEQRTQMFRQANGRAPASWQELINADLMRGIPRDPSGDFYVLHPGGVISVRDPDKFPFLEKGLPPGAQTKIIVDEKSFRPKEP